MRTAWFFWQKEVNKNKSLKEKGYKCLFVTEGFSVRQIYTSDSQLVDNIFNQLVSENI